MSLLEKKEELKKSLSGDINAMFYLVSMNGNFTEKDVNVLLDVIADKVYGK